MEKDPQLTTFTSGSGTRDADSSSIVDACNIVRGLKIQVHRKPFLLELSKALDGKQSSRFSEPAPLAFPAGLSPEIDPRPVIYVGVRVDFRAFNSPKRSALSRRYVLLLSQWGPARYDREG